jgi:protein-S-isoprenylcysteine O-methyltransferase Ste14
MNPATRRTLVVMLLAALLGARLAMRFKQFMSAGLAHAPIVISIAGFAAWAIYWEAASTHRETKRAESRTSRFVHELLVNLGFLTMLVPGMFPWNLAIPGAPRLLWIAGLAIQAAGFALAIWARRALGNYWSGRIEIKVDHQLIRSGPYAALRHPIYTAILTMALGMLLVFASWNAVAGFVLVVIAYLRKIRLEEANLRNAFGAQYDEYAQSTRALVPLIY